MYPGFCARCLADQSTVMMERKSSTLIPWHLLASFLPQNRWRLLIPSFCRFRHVLFFTGAAAGQNKPERVKGNARSEAGGGQGASEGAVCAKVRSGFGLTRNRRRPKRLSEPRPRGVPPVEGAVVQVAQLPLRAHLKSANCRFFVQIVVDGIS
jgi:hypothetical protein